MPTKKGFSFLLQIIVKGSLDAFLANTEAGQKEETKYFIYVHNNSVIRLDVKVSKSNIALLESAQLGAYYVYTAAFQVELCWRSALTYILLPCSPLINFLWDRYSVTSRACYAVGCFHPMTRSSSSINQIHRLRLSVRRGRKNIEDTRVFLPCQPICWYVW
jgi:hypothetical protein